MPIFEVMNKLIFLCNASVMLGRTTNDVISESKKLLVLLSDKLFTAGDIFSSFIRQPNGRSFLVAISHCTEFRHDNTRSGGPGANLKMYCSSLNSKVGVSEKARYHTTALVDRLASRT